MVWEMAGGGHVDARRLPHTRLEPACPGRPWGVQPLPEASQQRPILILRARGHPADPGRLLPLLWPLARAMKRLPLFPILLPAKPSAAASRRWKAEVRPCSK